MAGSRFD